MDRKPYPTDLKDKEWEILTPHLPQAKHGGRPRSVNLREILNAIFYRERTGCAWEMLPHDFPPTKTVYDYFNKWSQDGTWERINGILVRQIREAEGRDPEPSAAIIDSQSVKTVEKGANGAMTAPRRSKGANATC
jgi:putative transposase